MAISLVYNQQTNVDPAQTPADARGGTLSPAIGEGMEQLGQQGVRFSSDLARLQFQQQEADGIAQLQKNISDGYRNFTTSLESWKDMAGEPGSGIEKNGAGYTQKFVGAYDDWSSQLVEQQTTPRLKRMAAEQARTMGDHFFNQASQWQVGTNRAWRIASFEDSINTDAATIQQNPDLYDPLKEDKGNALEAIRGLHPADYLALKNKYQNTYAEAAFLGAVNKAPQFVVNMLTGAQPLAAGSIPQKIADYADQKGVPRQAALAFAQFESAGMNPNAVNGKSVGLYQLQPDTAAQYGVQDRLNPDQNLKGGIDFMADNAKAFKAAFNRDPTLPEWYSMHLFGQGGGKAFTKAPDNEPFIDFANKV